MGDLLAAGLRSREAGRLRLALRLYQGAVAAALYGLSTEVRLRVAGGWLPLLAQVLSAFPLMLLYRIASRNGAGGYYNTFWQMFTRLPQHGRDIRRRRTANAAYEARVQKELQSGVFRTVNALETGIVAAQFVALPSWLLAQGMASRLETTPEDCFGSVRWRLAEVAVFFCWHLFIGCNTVSRLGLHLFGNSLLGILQPEALWRLLPNEAGALRLEALATHPVPSI